ncbi:MAG: hypothetical protein V4506_12510 [Bacteroidota bacterium]
MTFRELFNFYGSGYRFEKVTGMSVANFGNWRKKGFIPIASQMRIQDLSQGQLKASFGDCEPDLTLLDDLNNCRCHYCGGYIMKPCCEKCSKHEN